VGGRSFGLVLAEEGEPVTNTACSLQVDADRSVADDETLATAAGFRYGEGKSHGNAYPLVLRAAHLPECLVLQTGLVRVVRLESPEFFAAQGSDGRWVDGNFVSLGLRG